MKFKNRLDAPYIRKSVRTYVRTYVREYVRAYVRTYVRETMFIILTKQLIFAKPSLNPLLIS